MRKAGWLYWRIYETRIRRGEFRREFGQDFDEEYGRYLGPLRRMGFLRDDGEDVVLTDRGAYWLHALEDLFSIEYVGRLWGTSMEEPWPAKVVL
jgi:oxygen-independent coproporphyrinogen-3 oxidase